MFICLKSSNIEGNLGRSPSYLVSVDAKFNNHLYSLHKKHIKHNA